MRKSILGRLALIVLVVTVFQACDVYQSALTITYAFRKAEATALRDPAIGGKITDVEVQRKINALEGEFDTAWNCAYVIYEKAAEATPAGQSVVVTSGDLKPCLDRAWAASFQLLETIRVFKPDFLTQKQDVTLPNGVVLQYAPITSASIPDIPLTPSAKLSVK